MFTVRKDLHDEMLFKDLVQKSLLQQKNNVKYESAESDSPVVHSSGLLPQSTASSAEGATSGSATRPSESSSSTRVQIQLPPGLPQPHQIRRRVTGKQPPSEFEINMIISLKEGILEIKEKSINTDQSEVDQELQLLQDLRVQERYQGDLQGCSEKDIKEACKKELISLSSSGHEVFDPVPLRLLAREDQGKVIESDDESASQMEFSGVRCGLSMSQHSHSACLNTPIDESKRPIFVQAPHEIQHPEPTLWRLKHQLYGLRDSQRSWQIHLTQVLKRMQPSQTRSVPCAFAGRDSSGNINLIVMAYVDDLVVSRGSASVQSFFQEIQKTFSLKHADYLTPDHPVELLGRLIKKRWSGQITMEFSQTLRDDLLGLFAISSRVTTNAIKIPMVPKEDQANCDKEGHSLFRTAAPNSQGLIPI